MQRHSPVPRYFFDVVDGGDEAALAEAVQGATDLVAHGIMRNEDISGQSFRIRDTGGNTVAMVSFREALPGRLKN